MAAWSFVAAVAGVQVLPGLPPTPWRHGVAAAAAVIAVGVVAVKAVGGGQAAGRGRGRWTAALLALACAAAGAWYAIERAHARLADALPREHDNQVARLRVRVASLPVTGTLSTRFDADVLESRPGGVPARIRVTWAGFPDGEMGLHPGQVWRLTAVVRRPHGAMNPHARDFEGMLLQRGVRALATVRGTPRLVEDRPWSSFGIAVQRVRDTLRARMRQALAGSSASTRGSAVVIALALGDQSGIARADWEVFNRSGITHLVSISGLHVTLVAGMAGVAVSWLWRRTRWRGMALAERLPAQIAATCVALGVAWCYCLLAGWGIPARRTYFTLAVIALTILLRLRLSMSRVLALAALAVTMLDPWAPVAPGFWLSFGAIAVLLGATGSLQESPAQRQRAPRLRTVWRAARVQCIVTLALTPILAFLTQQVAVLSPLANALAIPVVSFVVTPLSLLCAALSAWPSPSPLLESSASFTGRLAARIFDIMMTPVDLLAAQRWAAFDVAAAPFAVLVLALAGVAWALMPRGLPLRRCGWLLTIPMLCWRPERPGPGEWALTVLDVGQGSAAVIRTARHALVFDTGPARRDGSNAGDNVIVPFLRAEGIRRVDVLVVSHGDSDHAGGLAAIRAALPVGVVHASYAAHPPCRAGQSWRLDGVQFEFLHPPDETARDTSRAAARSGAGSGGTGKDGVAAAPRRRPSNASSCVLAVRGRHHAAVLPGDIGALQEADLATRMQAVDVALAAHHGSATSSSPAWIAATRARHVIVQAGHRNRFAHPAPVVTRRWQRAGARVWRTDHDGAIEVRSTATGLSVRALREARRRYWTTFDPP
jgi:competence protein ComEC